MKQITEQRLLEMVRIGVEVAGNQKEFARQIGVTPQYLTDILHGRRSVGTATKVLEWFGLERVVRFRRKDGGSL